MPVYQYEAVNLQGKPVKGKVEARSREDAKSKIQASNLVPTAIKQMKEGEEPEKAATKKKTPAEAGAEAKKKKGGGLLGSRVKAAQLTTFTSQLSTLVDAGLPLVRCLNILENQMKPCALKVILGQVAEDVASGSSLSEAMARHPKAFDRLYVNMVRAGEVGGVLDTILNRLAGFMEKSERIKKKLIGASVYPIVVMGVAATILTLIMIIVVPKFEEMFASQGSLPFMTSVLINTSRTMGKFWFLLLALPFVVVAVYKGLQKNPKIAYSMDQFKLKAPIFGTILKKSVIARFARTFGTLITSGVAILEALNIVKNSVSNLVMAKAIEKVHASIREGESIASPLGASGLFDDIVINMIDVGEETGELDRMLIKVADNYDEDVDIAIESMTSILEPLLIVGMGGAVGFIVVALFMPLLSMMDNIGKG